MQIAQQRAQVLAQQRLGELARDEVVGARAREGLDRRACIVGEDDDEAHPRADAAPELLDVEGGTRHVWVFEREHEQVGARERRVRNRGGVAAGDDLEPLAAQELREIGRAHV